MHETSKRFTQTWKANPIGMNFSLNSWYFQFHHMSWFSKIRSNFRWFKLSSIKHIEISAFSAITKIYSIQITFRSDLTQCRTHSIVYPLCNFIYSILLLLSFNDLWWFFNFIWNNWMALNVYMDWIRNVSNIKWITCLEPPKKPEIEKKRYSKSLKFAKFSNLKC